MTIVIKVICADTDLQPQRMWWKSICLFFVLPVCLSVCLSVYPPFLHVTFFFCLSKIIFDYFAIYWHFLFQLRFQKCVDAHPEIMQKVATTEQEKTKEKPDKEKDKVSKL